MSICSRPLLNPSTSLEGTATHDGQTSRVSQIKAAQPVQVVRLIISVPILSRILNSPQMHDEGILSSITHTSLTDNGRCRPVRQAKTCSAWLVQETTHFFAIGTRVLQPRVHLALLHHSIGLKVGRPTPWPPQQIKQLVRRTQKQQTTEQMEAP